MLAASGNLFFNRLLAGALFFLFQLSFKSIVFLYCRHEIKYNYCPVSFSVFFFLTSELFKIFGFSSRKVSQRDSFVLRFVLALSTD